MRILTLAALFFLGFVSPAGAAESGVNYEINGGVGYILQTEQFQFKVLVNGFDNFVILATTLGQRHWVL